MSMPHIDVHALQDWMEKKQEFTLLDVREPHEREISVLPGDVHISMKQIGRRYRELDMTKPLVVYCRSGARSASVVEFLAEAGFEEIYNLEGGINHWAEELDPSMQIY